MVTKRSSSLRLVMGAVMASATMTLIQVAPAHAAVINVKASARGSFTYVGFFGGPAMVSGPTPTVNPPSGGSASPLTATQPSHFVQFGPAMMFSSGQLNVSTQGTTGSGGSVQAPSGGSVQAATMAGEPPG